METPLLHSPPPQPFPPHRIPADPPAGNYGNNANYAGCPAIQYNAVPGATYFANSPVFVRGGALTGAYSRPLTLPYPAFSRACVDTFQPGFLMPLPPNQRVGEGAGWMHDNKGGGNDHFKWIYFKWTF